MNVRSVKSIVAILALSMMSFIASTGMAGPDIRPSDGFTIEYLLIAAHEQAEVTGINLHAGMDVDVVVTSEESPVECALVDDRSGDVIVQARSDGPRCTILKYKLMSQLMARVRVNNVGEERSHVTVVVRQ